MRVILLSCLLLSLLGLPQAARADTIDDVTVNGGGYDIQFSIPQSTVVPVNDVVIEHSLPPIAATVNGIDTTLYLLLIFPGPCGVCGTISGLVPGTVVFLPGLYDYSYASPGFENFSFLPGSYTTAAQYPFYDRDQFLIDISPEATTTTPEPASLWLVASASLGLLGLRRRATRP